MEGPIFSTRAESEMYRSFGASVIGMTNLQEAKLAREAELCFGTIALSTDYDCWHESEEEVTVEAVIAVMNQNVETAQAVEAASGPTSAPGWPNSISASRFSSTRSGDWVSTNTGRRSR